MRKKSLWDKRWIEKKIVNYVHFKNSSKDKSLASKHAGSCWDPRWG